MKKRKLKLFSFLLVAVMLVHLLPAGTVSAVVNPLDDPSELPTQTSSIRVIPNPDYEEPGQIREIESRREENVKHFLLPDNTVQAVVYADAVHRKDDSGDWQDISNDLSLTEVKGVKFYTTADERVVFAEKFAPNTQLWQLSENGYTVAMGMVQNYLSTETADMTAVLPASVTNAPQRRNATTWHSIEEARAVDNTASVVYANVKSNVDLEYTMVGNDIKENIVVKSRSNTYSYQFQITLTGLTAARNEDGSISLTDSVTEQQQYTIPAPYMYDAAGEISNAVAYTLKQTGEGEYTLTVTADSDWINAADRVFPVKIDPTVTRVDATDTYINPKYPDKNYGSAEKLWIFSGTAALFKSPLPTIPEGAEITYASLNVSYYYYDSVTTGYIAAGAYVVVEPWNASTHTWNIANQNTNLGISPTMLNVGTFMGNVGAYANNPGWVEFIITSTARAWDEGTLANNGIAIRYCDGTNSSVILNSYESAAAYRPYFIITYTEGIPADGVYLLENVGVNQFLDVRNGGCTEGTVVQQYTFVENNGLIKNQLFKITWMGLSGDSHYFSVRPMVNSGMGLSAPLSGDTRLVTLKNMNISEQFSSMSVDQEWIITKNGMYYTLKNGDSTQGGYLAAVGSIGTQAETIDTINNYSKWRLLEYQGVSNGLSVGPYPLTLKRGDRFTYEAYVQSAMIGRNGPPIYSVVGTDGYSTDKAEIGRTTGELKALKAGDVEIYITYEGAPFIWVLPLTITPAYYLEVKHYYDQGYGTRFEDASTQILSAQEVCSEILWELFELNVNVLSIEQYESCADECKNPATLSNWWYPCSHEEQHLTRDNVVADFWDETGPGNRKLVSVAWVGHLLDENPASVMSGSNEAGIIVMTTRDFVKLKPEHEWNGGNPEDTDNPYTSAELREKMIYTILHEESHTLGAVDHYCYEVYEEKENGVCSNPHCWECVLDLKNKPACIMYQWSNDLEYKLNNGLLDGIYCEICTGTGENSIRAHLEIYH